jgi:outer membrane receptor protein involved in Fe transport
VGAAAQLSSAAPLFGHGNSVVVGTSVDSGSTRYAAEGELGALNDDLSVSGVGVVIDQRAGPSAQPPIEAPVAVSARNVYGGLYAIDVFDVTSALSWTVGGRLNVAHVALVDRLGGGAGGTHDFTRFDPGTGLTYKVSDDLGLYAGYSESNRAPTPGELACADPAAPCLLDAFLVSDPPLKQVVARDIEFGLRGGFALDALSGHFSWKAGAWRTDTSNEILLLPTDINGFGFFQNAGSTRRQGIDLHLEYRDGLWTMSLGYSYLHAAFRDALTLSSNSPSADADGLVFAAPGDRIPLNPAHSLVASLDYAITPAWSVGADLRAQSGQYLVGDESNQETPLPGFATLGLRMAYTLGRLTLFGEARNLFDARYYSYGAFTELDGLPPSSSLSDPRTYSPAPGRILLAGVRVRSD